MTDHTPPEDFAARAAELERRLAEMEATSRNRLIYAELKTEAVRAGMVDLDGLKLLNAASLKLTEAGELVDGPGVMRGLMRDKPWLFGAPSTSSVATPPPSTPPQQKRVTKMTDAEYRVARAELLRR